MATATGTFTTAFTPVPSDDDLGRARIDKSFAGGLVGTSRTDMLSLGTTVEGSAAYVALDRFTGACDGVEGGFALVHTGLMERGEGSLRVTVVPDSGTGDLAGIRGEFTIEVVDGEHRYAFDYTLPSSG